MRTAIVAVLSVLSLVSVAAVEMKAEEPVCAGEMTNSYPCEWQRKLLVAQRQFAANLNAVDETTTGSITQKD